MSALLLSVLASPSTWHGLNLPNLQTLFGRLAGRHAGYVQCNFLYGLRYEELKRWTPWIRVAKLLGCQSLLSTWFAASWQAASALLWWWSLIMTVFTYLWLFMSCEGCCFFCICIKGLKVWISESTFVTSHLGSRSETPSTILEKFTKKNKNDVRAGAHCWDFSHS